jgi:hypothetical protein
MDGCSNAYNLTDCLLHAVLEAIKEHNSWDVPTFSVTSVIGVVALAFAAITVTQGVLSAGPGRRKCSKDAIGNWSKNTKRRWNWSEFRRDSLAYTPVLTSSVIGAKLHRQFIEDAGEIPNVDRDIWTIFRKRKKQTTADLPATWLNLLKYIGMDDFVWNRFQEQTKRTAADYLPSEIQAVPAFIDIDSIVLLAAMAGCDSLTIEPESGYPLITGTTIQVHFRRDPFLGLVASFECYEFERKREKVPSTENEEFQRPSWLFRHTKKSISSKKDEDFLQKSRLLQYMGLGVPAVQIRYPGAYSDHPNSCRRDLGHHRQLFNLAERRNLSWLLYVKPENLMEIFPAKSARIEALLGTLAAQGNFWSKSDLIRRDMLMKLRLPSRDWNEFWRDIGVANVSFPWKLFALCLQFAVDVRVAQREFRRLPQKLKIQFRDEIRNEINQTDHATHNLIDQTRYTSGYIRAARHFESDGSPQCANVEIYIKSAALMDLEPFEGIMMMRQQDTLDWDHSLSRARKSKPEFETAENVLRAINTWKISHCQDPSVGDSVPAEVGKLFGKVFGGTKAKEIKSLYGSLCKLASQFEGTENTRLDLGNFDTPIDFMTDQDDPENELFIYRAILVSVHCLIVIDNSDILESGIGNQVVPFL